MSPGTYSDIEFLDRYLSRILLNKISLVMFLKLRKTYSQGTPLSSYFRGLQLLLFLSTFNNVGQTFHLPTFNDVSQKFFFRTLINSYFCLNLIKNFFWRTETSFCKNFSILVKISAPFLLCFLISKLYKFRFKYYYFTFLNVSLFGFLQMTLKIKSFSKNTEMATSVLNFQ